MNLVSLVAAQTENYLRYLQEHYDNVQRAWKEIQEACPNMAFVYDDCRFYTLNSEIENHDLSKYSAEEFVPYRKQFYPVTGEFADDTTKDFIKAWEHHKNHNPHHWENWTMAEYSGLVYSEETNCVHMVVDWVAMSYKMGGTAKEYYESHKEKIKLPDWAVEFIYKIFEQLKL